MPNDRDLTNDFGGDPIENSGIPLEEMEEETDFDFSGEAGERKSKENK